jgi:amino acid permease
LKGVAVLSFVAFAGGVIMVIALVFCCSQLLLTNGLDMPSINWWPESVSSLLTATPLLCLCFAVQAGGGVVLATMKDTSQANVEKVANGAFTIVFVMDFILGFGAYLTFTSATAGDVIENLPESNPVSALARLCLLDLVVLSYMIMCIPCKIAIIDFAFGKNEAKNEASSVQFYGTTILLNVLALGLAVTVTDLSIINGLNGSICTNFNAFIFPAAFNIMIRANPIDKDTPPIPIKSKENYPLFAIALFGVVMLFLGTYQLSQRF